MNSEIVTSKNEMFISIEGKVSVDVREDIGETHVTIREDNYIPKRGDFVYISNFPGLMDDSYLSIYDCEKDDFYRSIFVVYIKDQEVCFNVSLSSERPIRKATSEECKVLFDKLKELGKKWNSDTKKIENIYVPKDGDIVYTKGNRMQFNNKILSSIGIFKEIKNNMIYCHCELFLENHFLIKNPYPVSLNYNQIIRPATDSEIKILTEDMADSEIFFYYEKKKLITIYQPKDGDIIYSNSMYNNIGYISIFKKFDFENDKLFTYLDCYCKDESIIFDIKQSYLRNISSTIKLRKATEEEKAILLKAIDNAGKYWDDIAKKLYDKPVEGDLCIFWNDYKSCAHIRILKLIQENSDSPYLALNSYHFKHCIKFESKEQFKKLISDTSNS